MKEGDKVWLWWQDDGETHGAWFEFNITGVTRVVKHAYTSVEGTFVADGAYGSGIRLYDNEVLHVTSDFCRSFEFNSSALYWSDFRPAFMYQVSRSIKPGVSMMGIPVSLSCQHLAGKLPLDVEVLHVVDGVESSAGMHTIKQLKWRTHAVIGRAAYVALEGMRLLSWEWLPPDRMRLSAQSDTTRRAQVGHLFTRRWGATPFF